jgi:hypothetical protein
MTRTARSRRFEESLVVLLILLAITATASFTAWQAGNGAPVDCSETRR